MGLKDWFIRREIAGTAKEAQMGKLGAGARYVWDFLSGWKTVIAAILLATEQAFPGSGAAHYIDLFMAAVGWQHVAPAVDPGALVEWGTLTVGLGHKLVKAYQQIRAGRALKDVHP